MDHIFSYIVNKAKRPLPAPSNLLSFDEFCEGIVRIAFLRINGHRGMRAVTSSNIQGNNISTSSAATSIVLNNVS